MLWPIWNLFVRYLTLGSLSNDNGDGDGDGDGDENVT